MLYNWSLKVLLQNKRGDGAHEVGYLLYAIPRPQTTFSVKNTGCLTLIRNRIPVHIYNFEDILIQISRNLHWLFSVWWQHGKLWIQEAEQGEGDIPSLAKIILSTRKNSDFAFVLKVLCFLKSANFAASKTSHYSHLELKNFLREKNVEIQHCHGQY